MINRLFAAFIALVLSVGVAHAQSGCSTITPGKVLTAAEWNACFAQKQNVVPGVLTTQGEVVNGHAAVFVDKLKIKDGGGTPASLAPVQSIFGRTGAVTSATNDYNFNQLAGTAALAQGGLGASQAAAAADSVPVFPGTGGAASPIAISTILASPPAIGGTAPNTSKFSYLTTLSTGSLNETGLTPNISIFLNGSAASPTTLLAPSVLISRTEQVSGNGTGGHNAGLVVQSVGNNSSALSQVNGISAFTSQTGTGDVVAFFGTAGNSGTGTAFGGFVAATASSATANGLGFKIGTGNNTGADAPYASTGSLVATGLDISYSASPSKLGSAGILVRTDVNKWDVGLAFRGGINSATIRDDSDSTAVFLVNGSHTTGMKLSGTFSGNAWESPSASISGAGAATFASVGATTFTGALSGNATTATTAGTATNVTATATATNAAFYPTFVGSSSTGAQGIGMDADLTYNPSSNRLTVPNLTIGTSASITSLTTVGATILGGSVTFNTTGNPTTTGFGLSTGNALLFLNGSSGMQWNNSGNTLALLTMTDGGAFNIIQLGLIVGSPTGGDKGVGTANFAGAIYANGTIGATCAAGFSAVTGRSVGGIVTAC